MISPGCSFKFDGLKQTFLIAKPGIEGRLGRVFHLLVNYRTTKDVLDVGNKILDVAKQNFPEAIEYALPEVAKKDLGLKVVLCEWGLAWNTKLSMGSNQAFICSSANDHESTCNLVDEASKWLEDHPFILTSLESKGLEFDDVIVAFDLDRKIWNVKPEQVASLRMLRELYVAVTRAKRRVVILIKREEIAMKSFFENLNCSLGFEEAESVLLEFDGQTPPEDWFIEGKKLFLDENFRLAARCFSAAKKYGWSQWAQGKSCGSDGNRIQAIELHRRAARCFHDDADYKHTLEVMRDIKEYPPWDANDDTILDDALGHMPAFYSKTENLEFSLLRQKWDCINVGDLKDSSTSKLFASATIRKNESLKKLVQDASDNDRSDIEALLPGLIADYHFEAGNHPEALRLFLRDMDLNQAAACTEDAIRVVKDTAGKVDLLKLVECWNNQGTPDDYLRQLSQPVALLLQLFNRPKDTAFLKAQECLLQFGRVAVKAACADSPLLLHDFDRKEFALEVLDALDAKFGCDCRAKALDWLMVRGDKPNATSFADKHLKSWTDDELLYHVVEYHRLRSLRLFTELKSRKMLVKAICTIFLASSPDKWDKLAAIDAGCTMLGSTKQAVASKIELCGKLNECNSLMKFSSLQSSDLAKFLDLCVDPEYASSFFGQECFRVVKSKEIIFDAVFFGGPYKSDVINILKGFSNQCTQSMGRIDILLSFFERRNYDSAKWYFQFALAQWSNAELAEVARDMGDIPKDIIINEYIRRELIIEAATLAINIGRPLSGATGAQVIMKAVQSRKQSEEVLLQYFSIWWDAFYLAEHRNIHKTEDRKIGNSQFADWLRLCTQNPKILVPDDEFCCLLMKFGPSLARYTICTSKDDNKIHGTHEELLQQIICFHADLKLRVGERGSCLSSSCVYPIEQPCLQSGNSLHQMNGPAFAHSSTSSKKSRRRDAKLNKPAVLPQQEQMVHQQQRQIDEGDNLDEIAVPKSTNNKKKQKKNKRQTKKKG